MKTIYRIFMTGLLFIMASCQKVAESLRTSSTKTPSFTTYTIYKGQHDCTPRTFKSVDVQQLNFIVRFNSSIIYTSIDPVNQYDINKLYGFSDGYNHTINSARIGWNVLEGNIVLHAFAHVNGQMVYKEISVVPMNQDINCSVGISGLNYTFTVNGVTVSIPRATTGRTSKGYQLYPYFGGDEVAPHDITIQIRNA